MIPTTLAPFLSVRNGSKAVDFYKSAFGAEEIFHLEDPTGAVVSNLTINGYGFWVADESPEHKNFSPETLNGGWPIHEIVPILRVPHSCSLIA